jgi:hypothetical protein
MPSEGLVKDDIDLVKDDEDHSTNQTRMMMSAKNSARVGFSFKSFVNIMMFISFSSSFSIL